MNRFQLLDGLEFNNKFSMNQEIHTMLSDGLAFVIQNDAFLPFKGNTGFGQLDSECLFIKRLMKALA